MSEREVRNGKLYCKFCDKWKVFDEFHKDCTRIHGRKYKCRKCSSKAPAPKPPESKKKCSRCKLTKPLTAFSRKPDSVDGYAPACQPCMGYAQLNGHLAMASPIMAKMLTSAWNKAIMF